MGMRRLVLRVHRIGETVAEEVGRIDGEILGQRVNIPEPRLGRYAEPVHQEYREPRALVVVAGPNAVDVYEADPHGTALPVGLPTPPKGTAIGVITGAQLWCSDCRPTGSPTGVPARGPASLTWPSGDDPAVDPSLWPVATEETVARGVDLGQLRGYMRLRQE